MRKYIRLWEWIKKNDSDSFKITIEKIVNIAECPIDHSFFNCKKELQEYGYEVGKISIKGKTVNFKKLL